MASINAAIAGGGGVITTSDATGNLDIQSGGSTVVGVTSTGATVTGTLAATGASTFTGTGKFATTIGVGNATPSASGSGITFPATQSASTGANTLDDYEEGTWSPVLGGSGGTSGQTYNFRQANYTKVGNAVTCEVLIQLTATGTITGNLQLQGLPFAISGYIGCSAGYLYKWTSPAGTSIVFTGNTGASVATLYGVNVIGIASTPLTTTAIANDSQWSVSFSYLTT